MDVAVDDPAGSAPATDTAPPEPFDLSTLNEEQEAEWRLTGTLPGETDTTTDPPPPADSAPATPAKAASTDALPEPSASEPGEPTEQLPPGTKPGTASRFQELLADRSAERARADAAERALRELRASRDTDAKADSSTAPEDTDPKPVWTEGDDYEKHIEAVSRWGARQEHAKLSAATQARQRVAAHFESFERTREAATARLAAAEQADPDFASKVNPQLLGVRPASLLGKQDPIGAEHVIADRILQSEHTAELLVHLSAHPDEYARLKAIPHPHDLMWELGRLDAQLTPAAAPGPAPMPQVSAAPPPPVILGSKTTEDTDPVEAALARGDEAGYIRAANAADLRRARAS